MSNNQQMNAAAYLQQAVTNRRVTGGYHDKLMAIYPLKHKGAWDIMCEMESNNWGVNEVPLGGSLKQYRDGTLLPGEKLAFDRALAFVSNLDGIQFHNLADNIAVHVTSPEYRMAIARQTWEEALHVKVYATMIEQLTDDPAEIYTLFLRDDILKAKNDHILAQSALLGAGEKFTEEKFALAIVSNMLLEGVYFYNAFLVFYALAKNNKMTEPAENVRLINR